MGEIDNQDLEHQRELVPEKGAIVRPTRVSPFDGGKRGRKDRKSKKALRKSEESLVKPPPD